MAVSLFVQIKLAPGVRDKFLELVTAHQGRVRERETYCQRFDILEQEGDDEHVCLYEVYDDMESFEKHVKTEYMLAYLEETKDMTVGRVRYLSTIRE